MEEIKIIMKPNETYVKMASIYGERPYELIEQDLLELLNDNEFGYFDISIEIK